MAVETHITIEHGPRFQRIRVVSPGGETRLFIEAPPGVALRALADYFTRLAEGDR